MASRASLLLLRPSIDSDSMLALALACSATPPTPTEASSLLAGDSVVDFASGVSRARLRGAQGFTEASAPALPGEQYLWTDRALSVLPCRSRWLLPSPSTVLKLLLMDVQAPPLADSARSDAGSVGGTAGPRDFELGSFPILCCSTASCCSAAQDLVDSSKRIALENPKSARTTSGTRDSPRIYVSSCTGFLEPGAAPRQCAAASACGLAAFRSACRMFSSFKSPWAIPAAWRLSRARASREPITAAVNSLKAPHRLLEGRVASGLASATNEWRSALYLGCGKHRQA